MELNEIQTKIVNHTSGAVMVLAGAGSGKTSVLTHRIANILNQHLAFPTEILAITFTNKAAGEIKSRLASVCEKSEYIWAQTFHSFCARILRYEIENLDGYNKNFSIYDESDKKQVLKKIIKSHGLKDDEFLSDLTHDISAYKNANLSLEEYGKINCYKAGYETNLELMQEYEQQMKQNNALDFDDLLIKTLFLFKTNNLVREKYQNQFRYILVDEFQDTNQVQYELVKILAGKHGNIFAVGDEDQSIYSWRGANVANIQKFLNDFPNSTLYKLEQNYRSTKNIIECANCVIKHNQNRIDKTLFTDNASGVKVQYFNKYSDREEAEFVVQEIYNLTHSLNYQYKDIAILMRLNALTRSFEDKLLSYDIPYCVFGGLKFYDRAEIKNVLAYLKLIINPQDNESFNRIINFPRRSIGDMSIAKLQQLSFGQSLMNTLYSIQDFSVDKTLAKFKDFTQLMQSFVQKSRELKVSELVTHIVKTLNLEAVYATGKEEDEHRMANIDELVASIKEFEHDNPNITLEEYLQNVSLISDIDTFDDASNAVTLATVHSAKGLEFNVVFVVGLEERYFPIIRDGKDDSEMEEERRLMYVAVTRARERLYLTNSSCRYMYGTKNNTLPSRFLAEMGFAKQKTQTTYSFSNSSDYNNSYAFNYSKSQTNMAKPQGYTTSTFSIKNSTSALKQNTAQDFKIGDKVSHPKFGMGTVTYYNRSRDILNVNFDGIGNKVLSPKFAPVKKVG